MKLPKVFLFCAILTIILGARFFFFYRDSEVYKDGQQLTFSTVILSEPKFIGNRQTLTANLPNGERIYLSASASSSFNYGDKLQIVGNLNKQLLKDGRSIWAMYFPKIIVSSGPLESVGKFRQKIVSLFDRTLNQPSSSLLLGIVFGIKEQMDVNFATSLRNTGVLHVIAASGMNVVMVGGFLSSTFAFFLKRRLALLLSMLGILFYAVLSGLEPSIIRASIMGSLVFLSQILGRQQTASYALFLSAFLMLFGKPTLVSDIGFQLSFAATAGLLYLRPIFEMGKLKVPIKKSIIGEDVATTISAQAATLPILLANFGTYSLWSILVNALVLWTVPLLMILGGLGAIFGLVFESLGKVFLYLAFPFLLYFEKLVLFFGKLEGVANIENIPWQIVIGYYLMLVAFIFLVRKR